MSAVGTMGGGKGDRCVKKHPVMWQGVNARRGASDNDPDWRGVRGAPGNTREPVSCWPKMTRAGHGSPETPGGPPQSGNEKSSALGGPLMARAKA